MKIYCVYGTASDCSGSESWPVRAFYSKDKAEKFRDNVSDAANNVWLEYEASNKSSTDFAGAKPLDQNMVLDFFSTEYSVWEMEID